MFYLGTKSLFGFSKGFPWYWGAAWERHSIVIFLSIISRFPWHDADISCSCSHHEQSRHIQLALLTDWVFIAKKVVGIYRQRNKHCGMNLMTNLLWTFPIIAILLFLEVLLRNVFRFQRFIGRCQKINNFIN